MAVDIQHDVRHRWIFHIGRQHLRLLSVFKHPQGALLAAADDPFLQMREWSSQGQGAREDADIVNPDRGRLWRRVGECCDSRIRTNVVVAFDDHRAVARKPWRSSRGVLRFRRMVPGADLCKYLCEQYQFRQRSVQAMQFLDQV